MSNNKQHNPIDWISNQFYELFEQYSEGNFDRITLNKLVLKATEQAKAMHKEETIKLYYAYEDYVLREEGIIKTFGQFYNETFGGNNEQQ